MRALIIVLALVLAALHFRLWVSSGGLREVWRLEQQVAERTEENRELTERNAALAAEVRDLKTGLAAAEERARSELGMVLPQESFYQIVPHGTAVGGPAGVGAAAGEGRLVTTPLAPRSSPSAPAQQHVDRSAAAMAPVR